MDKDIISKKIEAVLFYLSEPVDIKRLSKILEVSTEEIVEAVRQLSDLYENRGISLIIHGNEISLVTSNSVTETIDKLIQDEQKRDIGKAGIETLAIIAYKGTVSRREIEYIRGVNCQFALRNLLIRGLIEKKPSKTDERIMLYSITMDALMHLGIKSVEELPEYDKVNKEIDISPEEEEEN